MNPGDAADPPWPRVTPQESIVTVMQNPLHAGHTPAPELTLGIPGFTYADLFDARRLDALMQHFEAEVGEQAPEVLARFSQYRQCRGEGMSPEAVSEALTEMAPFVGAFLARLFDVEGERQARMAAIQAEFDTLFRYRSEVIGKLNSAYKRVDTSDWDLGGLRQALECLLAVRRHASPASDREQAVAGLAVALLDASAEADPAARAVAGAAWRTALAPATRPAVLDAALEAEDAELPAALLELVRRWSHMARRDPALAKTVAGWMSFKEPARTDFHDLVEHETHALGGFEAWMGPARHRRRRDGFGLTDPRMPLREVLYEVDHCIYCHDRDADSCSKGMRNKKDGGYKVNPLGVHVTGCPLEEKISEMHALKRQGDDIGALALVVVDNPMCPGTGHRICNDCMKGCIYQKTEPVNIPQIETNVLTSVMELPWGFEIYGLLTRWNPLNVKRPVMLPYNGKNVLVVGMGPAGYTLAHYLLNEGFGVVGIDGLKIEPLPVALTGDADTPPRPVRDFSSLYEDLDQRMLAGFGGVAEYGITVRWDKNFLKVIYLTLARRQAFRCYGGVRFGGTLSIEDAWSLGIDHVAIAVGAGKPTIIGLENNMIRGIRKASDFLMALQLTGAAKANSMANLQMRLPAGVIGGGLTAMDTTTEAMAYYPVQVEKILNRYERLSAVYGEQNVRAGYDEEELGILEEFLGHGRAIRAERERARAAGETPDFAPLVESWGGVTLFYRKGIKDSPAYRQNHEEIAKALEEGIRLAEGMSPVAAKPDRFGALEAVQFSRLSLREGKWVDEGERVDVPLRSLFVAAGTSPNTIYQQEFPDTFEMDRKFFQRYLPDWKDGELELVPMHDTPHVKLGRPAPLTSYRKDGRFVSFYGDNHPVYAGNVVKAMASAKDSYPHVVRLFEAELTALDPADQSARDRALRDLHQRLDAELRAEVVEVRRLTPTIVEVIAHAPMQARKFEPGQFYRVQNLESLAPTVEGTVMTAEGLALTGAWVDKEKGLVSLITLEMGSSSRLCALWKPGEQLVVMGVTGAPTEIPHDRTVILVGGGLGNAVLFSIGKALRASGCKVIYFAGYKKPTDLFKVEDIEAASDVIVWAVDPGPGVEPIAVTRPQDRSFVGNILDTIEAYASGALGEPAIDLAEADHLIAIGSDRMMRAVKEARHGRLAPYLKPGHRAIGSINSPMQCMMKGVCAQCLCRHVDPETGEECFVYSCYNQDQDLDRVDFDNLNARLRQNSVQEKLSNRWLGYLLDKHAGESAA